MGRISRRALKERFENEALRNKAFKDLVDSTFNINDDKIGIKEDYGLTISPQGSSPRLLSFYEKYSEDEPLWSISLQSKSKKNKGLNFLEKNNSRLFIRNGGNVGIGTEDPNYTLDVNGMMAAQGYVGTYAWGKECPADGKWHTIPSMKGLKGCQSFEIFAHINDPDDGRFGLTHALILMSSNRKGHRHKIHTTEASSSWIFGRFLNRIKFRWIQEENTGLSEPTFQLQIKTRSHFGMKNGKPKSIFYRITKKWDIEYENDNYPQTSIRNNQQPIQSFSGNGSNGGKINISGRKKMKIKPKG